MLNQGNPGLSHSLLLSVQGKHMSPFSRVGLSMFVLKGFSSGTTNCLNARCAKELQKQSMRTELEKGDAEQVKVL